MNKQNITITNKLTEEQKEEASKIYFEAFSKKFANFWLFESDEAIATSCLIDGVHFDRGLYAVLDGHVVGIMGLDFDKEEYKKLTYQTFRKYYSAWGAFQRVFWNFIIFKLSANVKREKAHVDAVAVDSSSRGMGIGSMLFSKAFEVAKAKNCNKISLTVVDTNPRAKKLYEELGFDVVKVYEYGKSTERAGFTKEILMVKEII